MGSEPTKHDVNQKSVNTIDTVRKLFETTKKHIEANTKASAIPVISEIIDQIQTAITVCHSILSEANELHVTRLEFDQTVRSLESLQILINKYAADPTPQNHQLLTQASGHIVDRICQKVVEDCGRKGLEDYFERIKRRFCEVEALLGVLSSSAATLSSFTNVVATNALHEEFRNDVDAYEKGSRFWLALSAAAVVILVLHIFTSTNIADDLVTKIAAENTSVLGMTAVVLLLAPRLAISTIIAIIAFSFWRNYQSYRHLTVASKAKLNIARIVPLIALNLKQSGEVSSLHLEFLRQIAVPGDTGFLANAKNQIGLGVGATKVSV